MGANDAKVNVVEEKTKAFALRIVRLYQYLREKKKEYVLSKQVVKSGTSIGANVKEAIRAQSKPDFYAKLYIALKEASETEYWLELLERSELVSSESLSHLIHDCGSIRRMLVTSVNTAKSNT